MSDQLRPEPALERPDLLAPAVRDALLSWAGGAGAVQVAEIDPELADTAAFCDRYGVPPERSANCVVVAGRRGGQTTLAACLVLALDRADVNGVVRRELDARKVSFAAEDVATGETGMEYGGITPIGLPAGWPVLLDRAVADADSVVVGSGVRQSKLILPGALLLTLPGVRILELALPRV